MPSLLDLLPAEMQGVRPGYGLQGAQISPARRHPGEYLPGEATRADVANSLWAILEAAGMAAVPSVGPHGPEMRAPGARRRPREPENDLRTREGRWKDMWIGSMANRLQREGLGLKESYVEAHRVWNEQAELEAQYKAERGEQ